MSSLDIDFTPTTAAQDYILESAEFPEETMYWHPLRWFQPVSRLQPPFGLAGAPLAEFASRQIRFLLAHRRRIKLASDLIEQAVDKQELSDDESRKHMKVVNALVTKISLMLNWYEGTYIRTHFFDQHNPIPSLHSHRLYPFPFQRSSNKSRRSSDTPSAPDRPATSRGPRPRSLRLHRVSHVHRVPHHHRRCDSTTSTRTSKCKTTARCRIGSPLSPHLRPPHRRIAPTTLVTHPSASQVKDSRPPTHSRRSKSRKVMFCTLRI